MKITMAHGSGGKATSDLINDIFAKHFGNQYLNKMEDSTIVEGSKRIAMTTDSFVVFPLFFPGGDIGKLAICGTVNDLLMSGSTPKYLTCGFIIEEGTEFETLENLVISMKNAASEADVLIVAGDTKVVEGNGQVYINTSGVGFLSDNLNISSSNCKPTDVIIVSGNLGEHHATILSSRMNIKNNIKSDCAPLNKMVVSLIENGINIKAMRDVTRGGLATVLNEFAHSSNCTFAINENDIPVSDEVDSFCNILGLDPLYMANEGKFIVVVDEKSAEKAVEILKFQPYGHNSKIIGKVEAGKPYVYLNTDIGGKRIIDVLYGEGLPRIC